MSSAISLDQKPSSSHKNQPTIVKVAGSVPKSPAHILPKKTKTAIVYCEGNFGAIDGKTANGLVRHSEKYEILSVIDSEQAGLVLKKWTEPCSLSR